MALYDGNGDRIEPEDVLDAEELADYYKSIGYAWWRPSHD